MTLPVSPPNDRVELGPGHRNERACERPLTLVTDRPPLASRTAGNPGGRTLVFDFDEEVEGTGQRAPSISPAQQEGFAALFQREIENLDTWAVRAKWRPPSPFPELKISVSGRYRFAQALRPQWTGKTGHMEFPAFRVATGEADVLHELVHVYFPNANRMLAEGLAVHLQQDIGANPSYPNFGEDLHRLARRELEATLKLKLRDVHLDTLAQITTPSRLMCRIGRSTVDGAWPYILAGSFVRFLIEGYGLDKFHDLYLRTPLVPLQRNEGSPGRWREIYGFSLADLELQWKSA
jgi:hypothetical protein